MDDNIQFLGSDPVGLIRFVVEGLVKNSKNIEVTPIDSMSSMIFELRVHPSDLGPVIGRSGRNARLIRTLLAATSGKKALLFHEKDSDDKKEEREYVSYMLEIIED